MQNKKTANKRDYPRMASAVRILLDTSLMNDYSVTAMVSSLSEMIGRKILAYMACETEPVVIDQWIHGSTMPSDTTQDRLRVAYNVSKIVSDHYQDKKVVQAWLQGKNPDLEDQAVMVMIRTSADPLALEPRLMAAAERFIEK